MKTLETDLEIYADGSVRFLSPPPDWLKPGRVHALLTVPAEGDAKPPRQKLTASPEMLAQRKAALEEVRKLDPYRDIEDPAAWQKESRPVQRGGRGEGGRVNKSSGLPPGGHGCKDGR